MTLEAGLELLRKIISDEQAAGFTDVSTLERPEPSDELVNYLDRATDVYCQILAGQNDLRLVKKADLSNGDPLPADLIKFCGIVPLSVEDGRVSFYHAFRNLTLKYFRRYKLPSKMEFTDEMDGETRDQRLIVGLAAAYALNKHEFDVSQDLTLLALGEQYAGTGQ
jgi:hypothetical protein